MGRGAITGSITISLNTYNKLSMATKRFAIGITRHQDAMSMVRSMGWRKAKEHPQYSDQITIRHFTTKSERRAYINGLKDAGNYAMYSSWDIKPRNDEAEEQPVKVVIVQEDDEIQVIYANVPSVKIVIVDSAHSLIGQEHISVSEVFESDGVPTEKLHEMWLEENWSDRKGKKRAKYFREELIERGF